MIHSIIIIFNHSFIKKFLEMEKYNKLQLINELESRGLDTRGLKKVLLERLKDALREEDSNKEEENSYQDEEDSNQDEEDSNQDEENTVNISNLTVIQNKRPLSQEANNDIEPKRKRGQARICLNVDKNFVDEDSVIDYIKSEYVWIKPAIKQNSNLSTKTFYDCKHKNCSSKMYYMFDPRRSINGESLLSKSKFII
jgi:hypothetical protein